MNRLTRRAFVLLQRILPKHLMTAAVFRLARIRIVSVKNWFITRFVAAYKVDVEEVLLPLPGGFATFNDFFTRELVPGARPVVSDPHIMVSPVDGSVSAAGHIDGDTLIQAKGIHYTLHDLLAADLAVADQFEHGSFATLYLAPHNYHRVHSPLDAELKSALYVPGSLYSVNETTVNGLPGLFTRNERLVCRFHTGCGPMILVFVGALHVGSISTPWTGDIRPQKKGAARLLDLQRSAHPRILARGDLLGWFNMGSTVIVLMPSGKCRWLENMTTGSRLKMGVGIASIAPGQHD